jgi:DNA-binding transcriptional LysR family regulator
LDLNDLHYFTLVVEHGGFSAAARRVGITKSKLSRRIALLEERLGVRLLQRSTRRLFLTEVGRIFYEHCAAMVMESDAALRAVDQLRSEPVGRVRMTCPSAMAHFYVARLVADFMRLYPKVSIELESTDRVLNLIEEGVDLALRALDSGLRDPGLIARRLASGRMVLVASPEYVSARGVLEDLHSLAQHDTIGSLRTGAEQTWSLTTADGSVAKIVHHPRLLCSDFTVQYHAALGGVGIALLPLRVASPGLRDGDLVRVAKDWCTPEQSIYLVYASRRGMLPSVRALIDYLEQQVPAALAE